MRPARATLLFTAILAVAAWTHVQIMTCCWSFSPAAASASSPSHHGSPAGSPNAAHEDHSCCPGETPTDSPTTRDSEAPQSPLSACDMGMRSAHSTACFQTAPPAEHLVSASGTFFQHLVPLALAFSDPMLQPGTGPAENLASPADFSSPPRYLALQRFLI